MKRMNVPISLLNTLAMSAFVSQILCYIWRNMTMSIIVKRALKHTASGADDRFHQFEQRFKNLKVAILERTQLNTEKLVGQLERQFQQFSKDPSENAFRPIFRHIQTLFTHISI